VLYPHVSSDEASPKAISGRTSYLQARLEFLRYPQVIPAFFNRRGFGPPWDFTPTSTCPWIGRLVSGLRHTTMRPVKTRFPFGSVLSFHLTSLHNVTRRPVLQKVHGCARALPLLVNIGFQVLFHSPPGVLFTFPSRYSTLSLTR
jgi:hypothetical protein